MAYTSFMRGDNTKMTNTPYTDGLIFLNTEEQALYLDDNNERIPMGGAGTGGHIIENNAGTDMTERTNLQFGGVYVSDDETNDRTKVNVTRNMTKDAFDQLTTAEKLGVIVTSNDPNDYIPFSADMVEYDNTNSGMTATDVQDAIDELNSDIANVGTMRYNSTTDMAQVYYNGTWIDWVSVGVQIIDFISTTQTDWIRTGSGGSSGTLANMTFSSSAIRFICRTLDNNVGRTATFKYANKFGVINGKKLKVYGTFYGGGTVNSSLYPNGAELYIQISDDNFQSSTISLIHKNITAHNTSITINETIDLSNYAGKDLWLRVYMLGTWNNSENYDPYFNATKFIIE